MSPRLRDEAEVKVEAAQIFCWVFESMRSPLVPPWTGILLISSMLAAANLPIKTQKSQEGFGCLQDPFGGFQRRILAISWECFGKILPESRHFLISRISDTRKGKTLG